MLTVVCSLAVGGLVLFLTYRHWYVPLRSRQEVDRLRREEAAGVPPNPRDYHYALSFDSDGLTITDLRARAPKPLTMAWAEVVRARAFKRDLLTVDCICLLLERADGTGVELNEEMARWESFVEALPKHLPGCRAWSEWFLAVAFPAFETNETQVYERPATTLS